MADPPAGNITDTYCRALMRLAEKTEAVHFVCVNKAERLSEDKLYVGHFLDIHSDPCVLNARLLQLRTGQYG